jgi:hypothetical protein
MVSHVFDNESKSATFGYLLYGGASYGAFIAKGPNGVGHVLGADEWLFAAAFASVLVAGKLAAETLGGRWGAKPSSAPATEAKPNDPPPAS